MDGQLYSTSSATAPRPALSQAIRDVPDRALVRGQERKRKLRRRKKEKLCENDWWREADAGDDQHVLCQMGRVQHK